MPLSCVPVGGEEHRCRSSTDLVWKLDLPFGDPVTGPQYLLGQAARAGRAHGGLQRRGRRPALRRLDQQADDRGRALRRPLRVEDSREETLPALVPPLLRPGGRALHAGVRARGRRRRASGGRCSRRTCEGERPHASSTACGWPTSRSRARRTSCRAPSAWRTPSGLDVRVPLFDRALAEASFALPPELSCTAPARSTSSSWRMQKRLPRRDRVAAEVRHERADHRLGARPAARRASRSCSGHALAGAARPVPRGVRRAAAAGQNDPGRDPPPARRRAAVGAGDAGGVAARLRRWPRPAPGRRRMKCIRCRHDSKYRSGTDAHVPQCGGQFAFEPRRRRPAHRRARSRRPSTRSRPSGQRALGVEHLYYEICRGARAPARSLVASRRLRRWSAWPGHGGCLRWPARPGLLLGGVCWGGRATSWPRGAHHGSRRATFDQLWERWRQVHGTPTGLIVRKPQAVSRRDGRCRAGHRRLLVRPRRDLRPRPDGRPAAGQQLPLREQLRGALRRRLPARPPSRPCGRCCSATRGCRSSCCTTPPDGLQAGPPAGDRPGVVRRQRARSIDVGLRPGARRPLPGPAGLPRSRAAGDTAARSRAEEAALALELRAGAGRDPPGAGLKRLFRAHQPSQRRTSRRGDGRGRRRR